MNGDHASTYRFSCALCNYRSYEAHVLYEHIDLHKDGDSFRCLDCDYKTDEQVQLMLHSHDGCTSYKCTNCAYKCNDKIEFVDHMELHHVPEFKCAYCDYLTVSESSLLTHFSDEHTGPDELDCAFCGFVTSDDHDYINHLRWHVDRLPFKCSLCRYETDSKNTLIDHLQMHGFDLLKCDSCYIKCVCRTSKKPSFSCDFCFYTFTRKCNLNRHIKLHRCRRNVGENTFYCAICGFGTVVKVTLINHLRSHRVNN